MEFGFNLKNNLSVVLLDGTTSNTEPISTSMLFVLILVKD